MRLVNRKGRRKKLVFNPNSKFIADAVQEFLKKGGTITRLEATEKNRKGFMNLPGTDAYDFLRGD